MSLINDAQEDEYSIPDQSNKIFVITGANSGIGYIASKLLLEKNATIIMACRNLKKANKARETLIENTQNHNIHIVEVDLASLESVRKCKDKIMNLSDSIDVLINNAGVFHAPQTKTVDGFELHLGVNHLGHFALTHHLLPLLSTQGRVVTVTSVGYKMGKIHYEDLHLSDNYSKSKAYVQSKLANVLFGLELKRLLCNYNKNIQSVIAHPGITDTPIYDKASSLEPNILWSYFYKIVTSLFAQSPTKGALPIIHAAISDEIESGDFIGPDGFMEIKGGPSKLDPIKKATDRENARTLWQYSEELTGISFFS